MLPHQRNKLLGSPPLRLEVVIIGGTGTSVHHEIDGAPATKDMSTWHNSLASSKPLGGTRFVERSSLGVQLHVARIYASLSQAVISEAWQTYRFQGGRPMDC